MRKFGYYKLFDNPNNKMFKIENEMDLHCKVVHLIRNYYPNVIMVAGLPRYTIQKLIVGKRDIQKANQI